MINIDQQYAQAIKKIKSIMLDSKSYTQIMDKIFSMKKEDVIKEANKLIGCDCRMVVSIGIGETTKKEAYCTNTQIPKTTICTRDLFSKCPHKRELKPTKTFIRGSIIKLNLQ